MQKSISVIVPIYHGGKYIQGLITQIEEGAEGIPDYKVELILVNDDPAEPISDTFVSDMIDIKVINTDINRGTHGARVRGLSICKGEFVLFLDQDDKLYKDFLVKQLAAIGNADAVVCDVLHDGHMYYDVDRPLCKAITYESMLFEQCMIISPGQVLIRTAAIPDVWKKNIMHTAGADDWLLWICMLCAGKVLAANNEVLFEHRIHYSNASIDSTKMAESEEEVVSILERNGVLGEEELIKIKSAVSRVQLKRLRDNEKCKKMFRVLSDWMTVREQGILVADYLIEMRMHSVLIYGYGHFGRHLLAELQKSDIEVKGIIDRNAHYIDTDTMVRTLEDDIEAADAVIIAILKNENSDMIEKNIMRRIDARVFWITDIISELLTEMA